MHEIHLVRAVLETAEKQATAKNAKHVTLIRIRFNPLTSHSGDHVRFSFDIVKNEFPLLKDTRLELTEIEPVLRCRKCGNQFHGHHLPDVCPQCGSINVTAINPTDMVLEHMELVA